MTYSLNLEEMEGRWIAHVAELPGAFATADSIDAAVEAAPAAIVEYAAWSEASSDFPLAPQTRVTEIIRAWEYAPEFEVNAFFASDRPALTEVEIIEARRLLYLARAELLDASLGLDPASFSAPIPGAEWNVNDVLRHVATGENWYLDKLGLAHEPAWEMQDTLGRLMLVRQHLLDVLPYFMGDERVVESNGELWTPRKVIRRALWHERDHAAHIRQLMAVLRASRSA